MQTLERHSRNISAIPFSRLKPYPYDNSASTTSINSRVPFLLLLSNEVSVLKVAQKATLVYQFTYAVQSMKNLSHLVIDCRLPLAIKLNRMISFKYY